MQLQEQVNKILGDRKYLRYIITIPRTHIKKLGWKKGDDLAIQAENGKLVITKKQKAKKQTGAH